MEKPARTVTFSDSHLEAVEYLLFHLEANTTLPSVEQRCQELRAQLRADYSDYVIPPIPVEGSK